MPLPIVIAVVNEKGGTGKTTTAVNLSAALGEQGKRVLLVDLDGQAASSRWLGVEEDNRLAEAMGRGRGLEPIPNVLPNVSLAPASGRLDSVAHDLRPTQGGQLRKLLGALNGFDLTLIDCPPSLGNRLIGNALLAATHVLVPVETSILALDGLRILLTTLDDVREGFGHDLILGGVLACRYDPRTRLSRLVLTELRRALPGKVFDTVIRENVRMRECPASGRSILSFAGDSHAAEDYRALAKEMIEQPDKWMLSVPAGVEAAASHAEQHPGVRDLRDNAAASFRQTTRGGSNVHEDRTAGEGDLAATAAPAEVASPADLAAPTPQAAEAPLPPAPNPAGEPSPSDAAAPTAPANDVSAAAPPADAPAAPALGPSSDAAVLIEAPLEFPEECLQPLPAAAPAQAAAKPEASAAPTAPPAPPSGVPQGRSDSVPNWLAQLEEAERRLAAADRRQEADTPVSADESIPDWASEQTPPALTPALHETDHGAEAATAPDAQPSESEPAPGLEAETPPIHEARAPNAPLSSASLPAWDVEESRSAKPVPGLAQAQTDEAESGGSLLGGGDPLPIDPAAPSDAATPPEGESSETPDQKYPWLKAYLERLAREGKIPPASPSQPEDQDKTDRPSVFRRLFHRPTRV